MKGPQALANVGEAKRATGKSMYTPVFYTQSQSSVLIPSLPSRKGKEREQVRNVAVPNLSAANLKRLEELSKRHIALADTVKEAPDSRSGSDVGEGSSKDASFEHDIACGIERKIASNPRIRRLRKKLADALAEARSNPCHGKWEVLSHLLRLGVTTGGSRWVGARAGKEVVQGLGESGSGWCNASTEAEWLEWENKVKTETSLKKRVAEWTKTVVAVPPEVEPPASQPEPTPKSSNPLTATNNALGFTMSKRSAVRSNVKPIDTSIPPPSFRESQIVTSTPKPNSPSSPAGKPPSSPVRRVYGKGTPRSELTKSPSALLPHSPRSPSATKPITPSFPLNGARSRTLVPINTTPLKRKNTADQGASKRPRVEDTTPKRTGDPLPTLTDLLASTKKKTPNKRKLKPGLIPNVVQQEESSIPGLTATKRPSPALPPAKEPSPLPPVDASLNLDLSPPTHPFGGLPQGDYDVLDFNLDSLVADEHNPYAAEGLYDEVDLSSPAKSLSSLAGSDSEDDDEDEEGGALPENLSFDPQFVSTQREDQEKLRADVPLSKPAPTKPAFFTSSNPFISSISQQPVGSPPKSTADSPVKGYSSSQPGSSVVYGKYNSQFDVKARVDEVDRLLEKDLGLELDYQLDVVVENKESKGDDLFSGWLRDVDEEEEAGAATTT